jgi:hypothetical protein
MSAQRIRPALLGALLLALGSLVAGCADSTSAASQKSTASSSGSSGATTTGTLAVLQRLSLALDTTAHYGERRFTAYVSVNGVPRDQEYIEDIWTDGLGGYSITPTQVIQNGGTPDPVFLMVQQNREGFVFRYRDFQVRDLARFASNYTVTVTGQTPTIAGRLCTEYSVSRSGRQGGKSYVLAVDDGTGILLRCDEYDASRNLISTMVYQQFTEQPLLTGIQWHAPTNQEVLLDLTVSLEAQLGFPVDLPTLLPAGYALAEGAKLTDASGDWFKATYDDGIEPLFFLIGAPPASSPAAALPSKGGDQPADEIVVHHVGSAVVLQGTIAGRDVTVAGKVSEIELLDALESSLP